MTHQPHKQQLPSKCYVAGVLYRPSLDEAREYYSRPAVLDELLAGMQLWHVRLEPGEGRKHKWFNASSRDELRGALMRLLDRMARNAARVKFPYFRIDGRRYRPATSWDAEDLWGLDLMLEQDGDSWRECWDAVLPVTKILDHFGVHYWLKYTGHHSLHVILPAESFPDRLGAVRLLDYLSSLHRRLFAFFARLCFQPLDDSGFHGGGGTNMPYALNEDTGLLNYPVLPEEIPTFQPANAHPNTAPVRSFWREFPDAKRGSAAALIEEVLRPVREQRSRYDGLPARPPISLQQALKQMDSRHARERKHAVVTLPWFPEAEATERILEALGDRSFEVRRAAAKAIAAVDDPRCEQALHGALAGSNPKLALRIHGALKLLHDISVLRQQPMA